MYDVWRFAGTKEESDKLFELVRLGKKTATSYLGDIDECAYSYISNYDDTQRLLIRTTNVYRIEFSKVGEEHAKKEGEGDLSLEYWREVHSKFFKEQCKENGLEFDENLLIICEEFEVVEE